MIDVDSMVVRLVTTEELAAAQTRESFISATQFTELYPALPREYGVDFDLERRFVLLPGESGDTASIHATAIAEALNIVNWESREFPSGIWERRGARLRTSLGDEIGSE